MIFCFVSSGDGKAICVRTKTFTVCRAVRRDVIQNLNERAVRHYDEKWIIIWIIQINSLPLHPHFVPWCNGSTTVFGSVSGGSNPPRTTSLRSWLAITLPLSFLSFYTQVFHSQTNDSEETIYPYPQTKRPKQENRKGDTRGPGCRLYGYTVERILTL